MVDTNYYLIDKKYEYAKINYHIKFYVQRISKSYKVGNNQIYSKLLW